MGTAFHIWMITSNRLTTIMLNVWNMWLSIKAHYNQQRGQYQYSTLSTHTNEASGSLGWIGTTSSQQESRNSTVVVNTDLEGGAHEAAVSTNATDSRPADSVVASREPSEYASSEGASNTGAQQQPSGSEPPSHATAPSKLAQVLLCFSLPANICRILRAEKTRASGDKLLCLHCIRVFSAFWIIWCHTYIYSSYYSGAGTKLILLHNEYDELMMILSGYEVYSNTVYLEEIKDYYFQLLINSLFAVDVFFVMRYLNIKLIINKFSLQ